MLDWLTTRATVGLAAYQLGVLERALELTAEYAREREQFGRPIGSFQAVAQRLADAYIDVEAVRLTMWEAAWRWPRACPPRPRSRRRSSGPPTPDIASRTPRCTCTAGRVSTSMPRLHRYFTAAKRIEFTLGSATAQLRRLGADLAATPA